MAITIEQIHETANKLQAQGIKPTQIAVREMLGGGSFSTIADGLRTWRQEQDTTAQLAEVVLPQEIAERTQVLTAQIWETAQQLANDRLVKERETLVHKEILMREEVEQTQLIVKTLESEQAELLAQLDTLTADNDRTTAQLAKVKQDNSDQAQLIKTLQSDLATAHRRGEELGDQLKGYIEKYDSQTAKIETLTAQLATIQGENTHNIENIKLLGNEIGEKRKEIGELGNKIANLEVNLASWQGKANIFEQQLTKAEALTATQVEKIERLTADLATAKATGATATATKKTAKKVEVIKD